MVLLKGFDENEGFKIFTNLDSRKGIELVKLFQNISNFKTFF